MRPWNIKECEAYAQQLRDKTRASTAEHAAQAIEYLLGLVQPTQEWQWHQAPIKTEWGEDMVVASVSIDKNHTVDLYCERSQTDKVEAMFTQQPVQEPWPDEPPGHIAGGVQEPVAICEYCEKERPVVQAEGKPWVGLTDEEIEFVYADTGYNDIQMFARAIEAKLREKNA